MSYPLFHPENPQPRPLVLTLDDFAAAFPEENEQIEFKEGFPRSGTIETLVAFSNAEGGVILYGVTNSGSVGGVTFSGEREAEIHGWIAEVHAPGRYDVFPVAVADRTVVVVAVDRRREGFAQLRDGRLLVRRGASNRALVGTELTNFVAQRSLQRFESTPTTATFDDASPVLVTALASAWGWDESQIRDRLREHDFLAADGRLTVAGALYLLDSSHQVLRKSFVEVFRYRSEGPDYDRRIEFTGPLEEQVRNTTEFVAAEVGHDIVILGSMRYELPRVPGVVLREALANAVAHRSYEANGAAVRVEIRPDRVVIVSPGGLPEPVTVKNIRDQTAARNLEVIKTLRRFGLAEDAGRGVDVMQDEMASNLLDPPEFVDDGSSVTVTLRLDAAVAAQERAWISEVENRGRLAPRDRLLLVFAARGEVLTNNKARRLLDVDSVEARLALQRLRDEGFLIQHGERGGAEYRVSPDLGPPPGLRLSPGDLDSLVLDMARGTRDKRRGPGANRARPCRGADAARSACACGTPGPARPAPGNEIRTR
ncbi:MAG: putative DNA binding domain-containing protein [Acidimicrobiia bacterium]|nr:putative DNA binding domain-containing protein [Acidimicrobiia bacterium]